ncbi:solute carrier family 2 member 15b, partial [Lates japonicus]
MEDINKDERKMNHLVHVIHGWGRACSAIRSDDWRLGHLTKSLLAVAFLASFGSSMLYGYNLAVVNSPAE